MEHLLLEHTAVPRQKKKNVQLQRSHEVKNVLYFERGKNGSSSSKWGDVNLQVPEK